MVTSRGELAFLRLTKRNQINQWFATALISAPDHLGSFNPTSHYGTRAVCRHSDVHGHLSTEVYRFRFL